ncbi:MAG: TadE family protein [Candidatus Korobacteraceae bacterium]
MHKRSAMKTDDSGQALVEFAIAAMMMVILLFGLIEFGRAIYDQQVITNLTGEGCSLASRGTSLTDTATAVVASSAPLNLTTSGRVIVTAVFNNNHVLQITGQVSQGGFTAASRVGSSGGGAVHLPPAAVPQVNQTVFVTEVFYQYTSLTPIGKLLSTSILPSQMYDVAYY